LPRQPGEPKGAEAQPARKAPVERISTGAILEERWEVGAQIAQTSSGMLFQGRDLLVDKQVVIKIVAPEFNGGESLEKLRERFRNAAKLMHPNIVVYTDMIELPSGQHILIAPYIAAGSLDQELSQKGSLSIDRTIALCTQISGAYTYAHSKSVPHRLQTSDVLLLKGDHERDVVKIAGFGVSAEDVKRMPPFIRQTDKQNMLQSGSFAQTQRRPLTPDEISEDIISFARVMREMHPPGAKGSDSRIADKGSEGKFNTMVSELLGKGGKDLYSSFVDLQHDLALVIGGEDSDWRSKSAAHSRISTRQRKTLLMLISVVAIAGAIAFGINFIVASTANSNNRDAGEQRNDLWPPGKATESFFSAPPSSSPATTTTTAKGAATAPVTNGYDQALSSADTAFEKGNYTGGIDTLSKYAAANDKTLTGDQRVNLYGRLAAAQLQVKQTDKAMESAIAAQQAMKKPSGDNALGALLAASTMLEIGLNKTLTADQIDFIANVRSNLARDARSLYASRFSLFTARYGDWLRGQKKYADAEPQYLEASQGWQLLPDHHIDLVKAQYGLGLSYQADNKLQDADDSYDHALKEAMMEPGRKRLLEMIRSDYADMLWKKGDKSKALSVRGV
jgi:serine/threonine protein kinase